MRRGEIPRFLIPTPHGVYTVTLFVIDDDGDMSSTEQLLVVT